MKLKAVKQGEEKEEEITMLVFYAENAKDRVLLEEILSNSIATIREHLAKDENVGTGSEDQSA